MSLADRPALRARLARRTVRWLGRLGVLAMLVGGPAPAALATGPLDAVLGLRAEVPASARTAATLGRTRLGSAVLIDANGLALTVGYLVMEASTVELVDARGRSIPADVVAYDHGSGFGLVRALAPIDARPLPLARADAPPASGEPLLVASRAQGLEGTQVELVGRRVFAGYWEYLLEGALFTSPQHGQFGGAALIDARGRLVGIGSLRVADARGDGRPNPGNMFVPAELLPPILGEMLASGHAGTAHPWLGITSREGPDGVVLGGVSAGGPAERAGLRPGDRIVAVDDDPVATLEMLYRSVWKLGQAGVVVPMRVERGAELLDIEVRSIDRRQWLRLQPTF